MAIADLQRRITEVGRIRLGRKIPAPGGGRDRADRLDTFRFTSAAQHLIEEVAALYGGEVQPWGGGRGPQFEVITDSHLVPVYVPPQKIDPFYEQWGNAVCTRRCDGIRDIIHDNPCDCNPDDRKCKPTTRLNVMLADVQGLGVWRLETHGIHAAGELAQLADLISGIQIPLPARLMLEKRGRKFFNREKNKIETLDYNVPIVLIDAVTSRHIQIGNDAVSQALRASGHAQVAAIEAQQPKAIGAAPAVANADQPPVDMDRALAAIAAATDRDTMQVLKERIKQVGFPQQLIDAWNVRAETLARVKRELDEEQQRREEHAAAQAPDAPPALPQGPTEPRRATVDTVPGEQDQLAKKAAMMRLLGEAGTRKIKTAELDQMIKDRFGTDRVGATAEQLDELTAELAGQPT